MQFIKRNGDTTLLKLNVGRIIFTFYLFDKGFESYNRSRTVTNGSTAVVRFESFIEEIKREYYAAYV